MERGTKKVKDTAAKKRFIIVGQAFVLVHMRGQTGMFVLPGENKNKLFNHRSAERDKLTR